MRGIKTLTPLFAALAAFLLVVLIGMVAVVQPAEAGGKHDWTYQVGCSGVSGSRPNTDSVDSNIRIKNLATGEVRTFNYHGPDKGPSGPFHYSLSDYGVPNDWVWFEIQWVQVNGTNYHWEGNLECGECPEEPEPSEEPTEPTEEPTEPTEEPTPTEPTETPSEPTDTPTPTDTPSTPESPSEPPTATMPPLIPPTSSTAPPTHPATPGKPVRPPQSQTPTMESFCSGNALIVKTIWPNGNIDTSTVNGHPDCARKGKAAQPVNEEGM